MDPATSTWAPPAQIDRARVIAFAIGGLCTAAAIFGAISDTQRFFQSYITSYLYVLAAPLGALGLMMLHHVSRGAWGVVIRRILEAAARTLPLMALFFIPVLLRMQDIYSWSDPAVVAKDELVAMKQPWLNTTFFTVRAVVYFLVWLFLAFTIDRNARRNWVSASALTPRARAGW